MRNRNIPFGYQYQNGVLAVHPLESQTVRAVFNRDTRTCHICTQTVTQNCKTTGSSSWFHNNRNTSCTTETTDPICEDIQM